MPELEAIVRRQLRVGLSLSTPAGNATFLIRDLTPEALVLSLGAKQTDTTLQWSRLQSALAELPHRQWLPIGSGYRTIGEPGTLDAALKPRFKRYVASYVARILADAGLATLDPSPPARIRLDFD